MDCVDGCVVSTVSFCETVDVLRWWRCIWCCVDGGVWTIDSTGFLLFDVNAVILENTSFLTIVGDEHGLTDGVLLADIVLLLRQREKIFFNDFNLWLVPDIWIKWPSWY